MTSRPRALMAGMTDYTGVTAGVILSHLRTWKDGTSDTVQKLRHFRAEVERCRDRLHHPREVLDYIDYFIDLFTRYLDDFERLLTELPRSVSDAHVQIVQQIYESATFEERACIRFKNDHIECSLKDESLRWLVDEIYAESRQMLIDYLDLSNLVRRLRTFVGTTPKIDRELEQKFRILFSPAQEQPDFDGWVADAGDTQDYSIGVIFVDVDDFKQLNSSFTESVVDRDILPLLQRLVRDLTIHRGAAYRHGGEELLVILPNNSLEETAAFAEKLRRLIEVHEFPVNEGSRQQLTVSVGVAAWPRHGNTLEAVINAANRAESLAKRGGKNRVQRAQ